MLLFVLTAEGDAGHDYIRCQEVTDHPTGSLVTQVARDLAGDLAEQGRSFKFLIWGEVGGWLGVGCVPQAPSAGPKVSRSSGLGSLGSASRPPLSIRT